MDTTPDPVTVLAVVIYLLAGTATGSVYYRYEGKNNEDDDDGLLLAATGLVAIAWPVMVTLAAFVGVVVLLGSLARRMARGG